MTEIKTFNDVSRITKLGENTKYIFTEPTADILETFENTAKGRFYSVHLDLPEWTGLCPKTGQPDMAHIIIDYIPRDWCIETKSLKLYQNAYRNYGCFMESTTNKFVDDIKTACNPYYIKVVGRFNARGGMGLDVVAEYISDEYADYLINKKDLIIAKRNV